MYHRSRATIAPYVLVILIGAPGCGGMFEKQIPKEDLDGISGSSEPGLRFADLKMLREATNDSSLLFMVDAGGAKSSTTCFEPLVQPKVKPVESPKILGHLQQQDATLQRAILTWMAKVLLSEASAGPNWAAKYAEPVVSFARPEEIRMSADQPCITTERRSMPADAAPVIALFGVKEVRLKSNAPIPRDRIDAMREVASAEFILFEQMELYRPAQHPDGRPKKGTDGRPIYVGPAGQNFPESKLPPLEQRPVFQIRLIFENGPLYLAYGTMTTDVWAREFDDDTCNLHLVFDDVSPRPPDCEALKQVGLGVLRSTDADQVIVRVATAEGTARKKMAFGQTEMIQAGSRVLVWVTPQKLEEGAYLKLNSLTLPTAPGAPVIPPSVFESP